MLERNFHARTFNTGSSLISHTLVQHKSCSNEPYLPLDTIRAISCNRPEVLTSLGFVSDSIEHLSKFDVKLPVEISSDMLEKVLDKNILLVVFAIANIISCLLVKFEVLEPKRAKFHVTVKSILTDLDGLQNVAFFFLKARCLKEDISIAGELVHKVLELLPGRFLETLTSLTQGRLGKEFPNFGDGLTTIDDSISELPDGLDITSLFFNSYQFQEQVFIKWVELKTSNQNFAALVLVSTLFLHLGKLEPSLVSIRLVSNDHLEEMGSGFETRLSFSIVSQV